MAQGVRSRSVEVEVPAEVQDKHEQSLIDGRDVLKQASPAERRKWIAKDGSDWSGAFGHDPRAYTDSVGRKVAEPGRDSPPHDPVTPPPLKGQPSSKSNIEEHDYASPGSDNDTSDSEGEGSSLSPGPSVLSGSASGNGNGNAGASSSQTSSSQVNKANRRSEQRQQRGIMQWRPARNAAFVKDEAKFAMRKIKKKVGAGDLTGREPDVETET
jgi:hypothetical protein